MVSLTKIKEGFISVECFRDIWLSLAVCYETVAYTHSHHEAENSFV